LEGEGIKLLKEKLIENLFKYIALRFNVSDKNIRGGGHWILPSLFNFRELTPLIDTSGVDGEEGTFFL
jgi:hypothetical protein